MPIMQIFYWVLLSVYLAFTFGCSKSNEQPEPVRPDHVNGWRDEYSESGVHYIGEFMLREGESTDNGKFGIKIVSIPPRKRQPLFEEPPPPEAVIRFYRVADQQVLCERTIMPGNGRMDTWCPYLSSDFGIDVMGVREINTVERWVWFDLRGNGKDRQR